MDYLEALFELAGSLICHQLPSRSLTAGNMTFPVCARDTGIYAGIFVSALFLTAFRRLKAQKPPGIAAAAVMCLFMLPMIMDGILSYTGITQTNNTVRLFTGLYFGLPIPIFLAPAAHFSISGTNEAPVLKRLAELWPVYGVGTVLCLLLLKGLVPYHIAGLIFISGLVFLISRLSYTIFARIRRFRKGKLYLAAALGTICALTFLFLLSRLVFGPLKRLFG